MTLRMGGIVLVLVIMINGCSAAMLNEMMMESGPLDEQTVAAGLKEALHVGTDRTVGATSTIDGFLANAAIRILMPQELNTAANALRTIGLGNKVDDFEVAMNRAAEKASGEARSVFWAQIKKMTLADAFGILNGDNTAATDYFHERTASTLRSKFSPIVEGKMSEVGLYNAYNQLMDAYTNLPLVSKPAFNLETYITDKTLTGLFTVLAEEETEIRKNPGARTSALLRRVFGKKQG